MGSPARRNAARSRGTDRIVRRRSAPALNRSPRRWAASPDGFVVRTPAASNAIPINSWRVAPDREKCPPQKPGAAPRRAPQPSSLFGKRCKRFDGCDWCCVCVDIGDLTVSQRPFWGRPVVLPGEEINTGTWLCARGDTRLAAVTTRVQRKNPGAGWPRGSGSAGIADYLLFRVTSRCTWRRRRGNQASGHRHRPRPPEARSQNPRPSPTGLRDRRPRSDPSDRRRPMCN